MGKLSRRHESVAEQPPSAPVKLFSTPDELAAWERTKKDGQQTEGNVLHDWEKVALLSRCKRKFAYSQPDMES